MIPRTVKPEPGIYYGVPEEEYFSWDCFSKSMIPATLRSARHLRDYLAGQEPSDPMKLGSLVDAMLLEPKALEKYGILQQTYVNDKGETKPWNANAKPCKAEMDALIENGLIPVKQKFIDSAEIIKLAVLQNDSAASIIKNSKKQVAMVWIDEDTGVLCKGRIDCLTLSVIGDIKTTRDASEKSFRKDLYNFGYHHQSAMYTDGYATLNKGSCLPFQIIAVENEKPFGSAVYEVGERTIQKGREEYKTALDVYVGYLKDDPELSQGYPSGVSLIDAPEWALRVFDENKLEDTE